MRGGRVLRRGGRVTVDFEDAAGEGFELLGGDFDDAFVIAPLDDREAPGFVFEDDAGVGATHGAEVAAGLFVRSEGLSFFDDRRWRVGHEAEVGGLLDEGKASGVDDGEDAVQFFGDEMGMGAGVVVEAPIVDEGTVVLREEAEADAEAGCCTSSGMS